MLKGPKSHYLLQVVRMVRAIPIFVIMLFPPIRNHGTEHTERGTCGTETTVGE